MRQDAGVMRRDGPSTNPGACMAGPDSVLSHAAGCAGAPERGRAVPAILAVWGWPSIAFLVAMSCWLSAWPARAEAPAGFADEAGALVERYAAAGIFSGAVIVAEHGRPLLRRAYGLADREWGVPNAPDTRFRIASLTKQFTAAAILKLAESGRLGLDDPAIRHVPDLPAAWAPITVRMLLDHTSGLPNITALPDYPGTLSRLESSPRALIGRLEREGLLFPAGTAQEYSNTGYILLAEIVARVTGRSFSRYLDEAILAPVGLADTADADPARILTRRAAGHRRVAGEWRHAPPVAAAATAGAGNLVSTVDDLVAWDTALFSGRVIAKDSLDAMFRDGGHGYGLGWYLGTAFGQRLWSHGGFIDGFTAIKDSYPDCGLTIVVLANTETAPAQTMSRALAALYFGGSDPTQAVQVAGNVLSRYVGRYRIGPRTIAMVTREGEHLSLRLPGQPRLALEPESDRTFVADAAGNIRITFDIEPDGRPTGAMLHRDGRDQAGPRLPTETALRRTERTR